MTQKLFGTDGIRGSAGEFPLDDCTIAVIGRSMAERFREELGRTPRFITGRDTRESGPAIEKAFHAGATAALAECVSAGVMTTPGVAYLTPAERFDAGIVISASHNPFQDNGIKIFMPDGRKSAPELEKAIEADIAARDTTSDIAIGSRDTIKNGEYRQDYIRHLLSGFPELDLTGKTIVIDCANGAGTEIAPETLERTGAKVIAINASPDGRNINRDCGSLHLEHLQKAVVDHRADIGIALDGDADRALFVDETGSIVDGDATLWIIGSHMMDRGALASRKVVATLMSNLGLEVAFRDLGVELIRTAVGDKYVLEGLLRSGSELGGEQSGHVIFPRKSFVGDGIMTALTLLDVASQASQPLSALAHGFTAYPQILINVPVHEKRPFAEVDAIASAAREVENELDGNGRLLLRYSGTENLARVMIEGQDSESIREQAERLATVIEEALGNARSNER
jgi:phosphoglucosamine mutase